MDDEPVTTPDSLRSGLMAAPDSPSQLRSALRRARRALLARRRLVAASLAAVAVLAGVRAAAEPPAPTARVLVAAADLPAGRVLDTDDVVSVDFPVDRVPEGTVQPDDLAAGRTLAAPLRRGEPVTDARLVTPALLAGYPGLVAAPVRVADADAVRLLAVGDRVDLVGVAPEGGPATVVVADAPVAALPRSGRDDGLVTGALVVLAVTEDQAIDLAGAAVRQVLSVVLKR